MFHLKQVEHTDFISHISEITGRAFIQLGLGVSEYHALSALDALDNYRANKAPAFSRTRCANHQHISGKTAFAARRDVQRKAVVVQRIIAVLAVYRAGKVVQSACFQYRFHFLRLHKP